MSFMTEIEKSLFDFKLLWQFQDLHDPIGVLNESILLIIISDGPLKLSGVQHVSIFIRG